MSHVTSHTLSFLSQHPSLNTAQVLFGNNIILAIYFESLRDFLRLSWEKILTTKLGLGFLCHTDSDNKLQVLEGVRLSSKSAPRQTTV